MQRLEELKLAEEKVAGKPSAPSLDKLLDQMPSPPSDVPLDSGGAGASKNQHSGASGGPGQRKHRGHFLKE